MIECIYCNGKAHFLAKIGTIYYYRCEDCGGEFTDTEDTEDE